MTLDQFVCVYFAGALVTALSTSKLNYFGRVVLLWPFYWCYMLAVIAEMAVAQLKGRNL